jgi:hypothetical protein
VTAAENFGSQGGILLQQADQEPGAFEDDAAITRAFAHQRQIAEE